MLGFFFFSPLRKKNQTYKVLFCSVEYKRLALFWRGRGNAVNIACLRGFDHFSNNS